MENIILNVQGMSCNHCVKSIEGSVGELKGISNVKVHLETGTVDVEYNSNEVTIEAIKKVIDAQGYKVN